MGVIVNFIGFLVICYCIRFFKELQDFFNYISKEVTEKNNLELLPKIKRLLIVNTVLFSIMIVFMLVLIFINIIIDKNPSIIVNYFLIIIFIIISISQLINFKRNSNQYKLLIQKINHY